MASLNAGHISFRDLFSAAKFDVDSEAAADYNNGQPDYRRVQVGGLPFSGNLDEVIYVPPTATELSVTLDGKEVANFDLDLDDFQKLQRTELVDVTGIDPVAATKKK